VPFYDVLSLQESNKDVNNHPSKQTINRRRWMINVARNGLLGAIAGLSGLLLWRRHAAPCPTPALACRQCALLGRCELPRARQTETRATTRRRRDPGAGDGANPRP